ncbi:MAG: PQQ-like beta-propeller repeat protein [candidate division KSB1 bacterium]|nr:PQQ-like beta-propeller repeat protein [candidate division KSB1 bacterium]MDZ7345467.1 PQQ-like beta-propeller repeat protein [candidate division KSB1 bacterium]
MGKRFCRTLFVLLALLWGAYASDWPQFMGPNRNGTSPQKGILRNWPSSGPKVLWTVSVGRGFGGPAVKDGKVYLLDRDDQVGDTMRCFDLNTGKELWNYGYKAPGSVMFPGSRSVPTIDGDYIYSCGHNGDLYCINLNTHKPVWNKNIWKDFGGDQIPTWAITQNPLIYQDLVIVASQAPKAGVVAYEKLSGKLKWSTPPLGAPGYSSPTLVKIGGKDQVVTISASSGRRGSSAGGGKVAGIDPLTGKILWEYDNWQCVIPVPFAVDAGENRLLISGAYEAGSALIRVDPQPDGSYRVTELFKNQDFGSHTIPPIFYKDHFYAHYTTNERRDGLVCMGIDGQIKWKTGRQPLFNKGSMILADGLLLSTDGQKTLYLIEPDPAGFKPLASAELLTIDENMDPMARRLGDQNWAPAALADGKLLIRDLHRLLCVQVAQ